DLLRLAGQRPRAGKLHSTHGGHKFRAASARRRSAFDAAESPDREAVAEPSGILRRRGSFQARIRLAGSRSSNPGAPGGPPEPSRKKCDSWSARIHERRSCCRGEPPGNRPYYLVPETEGIPSRGLTTAESPRKSPRRHHLRRS